MYEAKKIATDIYWVGVIEWNERYIHGFSMPLGSTNNAYIITDEKTVLIDTCTQDYSHELIERIKSVVDPASIDVIISNHSEKDHAGSLIDVLKLCPNAEVVTTHPKGQEILKTYLGEDINYHPVKTGDSINIGKRELQFIQTPMVHWPDNMVTYSPTDKILFSNDAFGQFFATSKRFDDEVDKCSLFEMAKRYYANIVFPYNRQTARALDALEGIDITLIAPSHGAIWRSYIPEILECYRNWSEGVNDGSAVVVYSTMYGSTERMAKAITEAFVQQDIDVRMYNLDISDIADIMTSVLCAKYVAIGSATHNNTVLPPMGQFLTYFKGLVPHKQLEDRIGFAFGSYGWVQAAQTEIADILKDCGYELPLDNFECKWNENENDTLAIYHAIEELLQGEK